MPLSSLAHRNNNSSPLLAILVVGLMTAVSAAALYILGPVDLEFKNPLAEAVLYLIAGSLSFIVFFKELYAFFVTGSRRLLWMSAGFFILGSGLVASAIIAGILASDEGTAHESYRGVNSISWIRTATAFAASTFVLIGTVRTDKAVDLANEFRGYLIIVSSIIGFLAVTLLLPSFAGTSLSLFLPNQGWSPLAKLIELNVFIFFMVIAVVYARIYCTNSSRILFWFIIGFSLLSLSEAAFVMEKTYDQSVDSYAAWLGRLFLTLAFVVFVKGLSKDY